LQKRRVGGWKKVWGKFFEGLCQGRRVNLT
jgi:hypothetical protein